MPSGNFLGGWNAFLNEPFIINGVGNSGDYYIVSVPGNQNLGSGIIVFSYNDYVVYNGYIWLDESSCCTSSGGGAVSSVSNTDGTISVSPNIGSVIVSLPVTGVISGSYSYPLLTVDDYGRITTISNGSSVGLITLNGDNTGAQTLTVNTLGTNFNIVDDGVGNHEFNLPISSSINTGKLSNTDWSIFNNKQDQLLGTGFVYDTSGTISYISGSSSQFVKADGSLDSTSYGIVNSVSIVSTNGFTGSSSGGATPALTLTCSVTGVLKSNGSTISAATDGDITGKLLTGYSSGSGTISASDSILQAIQKLNGNIGLLNGSVIYQGTWNASTNTPTLISGVGVKGFYYKVSVAGTTTLDGISSWNVGDSVIFDGLAWDKIDGISNEVLSVFGRTGAVVGTATDYSGVAMTSISSLNGLVITPNTGVITTGTWRGAMVAEIYGGTNQNSYTTGDILYSGGANTLSKLGIGSTSNVLTVVAGIPSWQPPATSGTVTSVSGTTNRVTSTGGATPMIDISTTFETLLGKVANPLSQFASTTSSQLAGVISDETGSGSLVFGTDPSLTVTTPSTTSIGYLGIPQNSKSAAYTTVMTDAGKHIYHPSADTTARIWTIDSNANVPYPIDTAITFVNDTAAGVITIAITSDTLLFAGTGGTGNRTLAASGIATALKITSTKWIISGINLT